MPDNNSLISLIIDFVLSLLNGESTENPVQSPQPNNANIMPTKQPIYQVTKDQLLKGRDKQYASEYTQEISDNLDKLLIPLNKAIGAYGKPVTVNSGWRPAEVNANTPGAAPRSNHMRGLAADIADPDGELMRWVLNNLALMKELGLYFEHFCWTHPKGSAWWVHFQCLSSASGKRIYIPSNAPNPNPEIWDGKYDPSFN